MIYKFEFNKIKAKLELEIPNEVYYPAEDTFLLLESVELENPRFIVEVGCGSGIISIYLARKHPKLSILAVDIDKQSAKITQKNAELNHVQHQIEVCVMDKMNALRPLEPDAVVWNPPYLPAEVENEFFTQEDQQQLFGGPKGYESALDLIKKCKNISPKTTLYLILSSLGWDEKLIEEWEKEGYYGTIINVKKVFFETLYAVKFEFERDIDA